MRRPISSIFELTHPILKPMAQYRTAIIAEHGGQSIIIMTKLADAAGVSRQTLSTVVRRGTCAPITAGRVAITQVIMTIASLFSALSGTTVEQSEKSAEALNGETSAIKGTGAAAKKAAKSLAAFDEINQLSSASTATSGGGSSSSGAIAPSFSGLDDASSKIKTIADLVLTVGAGLLLWKISSAFTKNLLGTTILFVGLAMWYTGLPEIAHIFSVLKDVGLLVTFYLVGCVSNKFCDFRMHKRLVLLSVAIVGLLYLGVDLLHPTMPGVPATVAAVLFAAFLLLSPAFSQYLFFADWSKELRAACMPGKAVAVTANWSYKGGGGGGSSNKYCTITATAGKGGSISPNGNVSVREDLDKTFTITSSTGYVISDVLVNSKSVGAVRSYTFTNVRSNQTISVTFKAADRTNPQSGVGFQDVADDAYYAQAVACRTIGRRTVVCVLLNEGRFTGKPYQTHIGTMNFHLMKMRMIVELRSSV